MASSTSLLSLLLFSTLLAAAAATIRMYPKEHVVAPDGDPNCESWKLTVELNDAGAWNAVPRTCLPFVCKYFNSHRYLSDSEAVADCSLNYANSLNVANNSKDAWVFDVDETLLSNLPYYKAHGFGSEPYNATSFNEWVDEGVAPALPASLRVFNKVKGLGIKIFLLTGRPEAQRNVTVRNLIYAGFYGWEKLILRGDADEGKKAIAYKSEKRSELEKEGYIIQGSSGDQWSDLVGYALSKRSFKLPNPMYYIP